MNKDDNRVLSREEALVNVLERLTMQIDQIERRLVKIEKHQAEQFMALETSGPKHLKTDMDIDELRKVLLRYHSEMGKIVFAQDHMGESMKTLANRQEAVATRQADLLGGQEIMRKSLAQLGERFSAHEKKTGEHYSFSIKQDELFSKRTDSLGIKLSKLHGDTEKLLGKEHRETQRRLDDLKLETMRRLLTLDGIEASLAEVLHRTEPPPPKPPNILVRALRKTRDGIHLFFAQFKLKSGNWRLRRMERKAAKERGEKGE